MEQPDSLKSLKSKPAITQLDRVQRIVIVFFLLPLCGFCAYAITPFVAPEVIGQIAVDITHYPEAQLLYDGYRIYGSSEWHTKTFIFWTEASMEDVQNHYEKFFPYFTERDFTRQGIPLALQSGSRLLFFGIGVLLVDANQDNRSRILDHSYDDNPYDVLDDAPRNGTLIVFSHDTFSP
jgi:hypothetical protein